MKNFNIKNNPKKIKTITLAIILSLFLIFNFSIKYNFCFSKNNIMQNSYNHTTKAIAINNNFQNLNSDLIMYNGEVAHLFTHCLVAYPNLAFNNSNPISNSYINDCLTILEFKNIINDLYKNNYMLVDINKIFEIKNGKAEKKEFLFPKGKKPLVLSFDDVVYDIKKKNFGMVDKLIVYNGKIASFTTQNNLISYNNEFLPILENFIEKNPNFSFENAKGIICLTGFDGILGYKTHRNNPNKLQEIKEATIVVNKLKSLNWKFACHSYSHGHMKKQSVEKIKSEIYKWKTEVEPLIGKTNLYVYPYGEWAIAENSVENKTKNDNNANIKIDQRQIELFNAGFKFFFGVGCETFYGKLPFSKPSYLFMDRCPLDGYTLKNNHNGLKKYFDTTSVYDYINRPK